MTNQEMRQLAASLDLRGIRKACGVSCRRIALALGVDPFAVFEWERRNRTPNGALGVRYMRIMIGLRNHLEVPEGDGCEAIPA